MTSGGATSGGATSSNGGSSSSGFAGTTSTSTSTGAASSSSGGGTGTTGSSGAPITCQNPSTAYQMNGGNCGTERWSVKTGTDNDVLSVSLVPVPTTIAQLTALPVPANQSATCNRNPPTETTVYELVDVNLHFHSLESDSDYHIVASDQSGNSMIVEAVYPGCVGHDACSNNAPFTCEISRTRESADALHAANQDMVGTVVGVGFFDFLHGQSGVAPNGIELHPLLALCLGQGCNPFAGY